MASGQWSGGIATEATVAAGLRASASGALPCPFLFNPDFPDAIPCTDAAC